MKFSVQYDVSGVDRSIHSSQRLLYAVNALRLSIVDMQKLARDPSLGTLLWTGIQLTRTWRLLYNLVKRTNQAQRMGMAQRAFAVGQTTLTGTAGGGALATLIGKLGGIGAGATGALLAAILSPYGAAIVTAGVIIGYTGYHKYFFNRVSKTDREEFIRRQRDIAKTQGWDY